MNSPLKKTTPVDNRKPAAPAGAAPPALRRTFVMTNRHGLHARPCAVLIRTLQPFACEIKIECGEATANGNSILGVMSLAAGYGSKLTFTISGSKATGAMAAVQQLFETQFEKAYTPENKGSSGMSVSAQTGNPGTKK